MTHSVLTCAQSRGTSVRVASMYATRWLDRVTMWRTSEVLPLPSGPVISVSRPRGSPPDNARSSASIPVGTPVNGTEGSGAVTAARRCLRASREEADTYHDTRVRLASDGEGELLWRGLVHEIPETPARVGDTVLGADPGEDAMHALTIAIANAMSLRIGRAIPGPELWELGLDQREIALPGIGSEPQAVGKDPLDARRGDARTQRIERCGIIRDPWQHRRDIDSHIDSGRGQPTRRFEPCVWRRRPRLEATGQVAVSRDQRHLHDDLRVSRDTREEVYVARDQRALREDHDAHIAVLR